MMKKLIFCVSLLLCTHYVDAQKWRSFKSLVHFLSTTALENIEAENKNSVSLFDQSNNRIAFSVPIHDFKFEHSLMQEHFNEKYMETEIYPSATFQGTVEEFSIETQGEQNVTAVGKLTIHGVTRDVAVKGIATVDDQVIRMRATFMVRLEDHKVKIPKLLWQKVAEQVEVTVDFSYKPAN